MSSPSHSRRWKTEQLHQYKLLEHKLQRAHAPAAQVLVKLARLHPAHMQYEGVCNDLVDVVHSISLLIACCEAIKASGFRPKSRFQICWPLRLSSGCSIPRAIFPNPGALRTVTAPPAKESATGRSLVRNSELHRFSKCYATLRHRLEWRPNDSAHIGSSSLENNLGILKGEESRRERAGIK